MREFTRLSRRSTAIARSLSLLLLALLSAWGGSHLVYADHQARIIETTPSDSQHMISVRAGSFKDAAGKSAKTDAAPTELFKTSVKVSEPLQSTVVVKSAGDYQLWVRVAEGKPQLPLSAELLSGTTSLLKATVNDGPGGVGKGGAKGFELYRNEALQHGTGIKNVEVMDEDATGAAAIVNEMNQDANPELGWVRANRVEETNPKDPYYWWNVGRANLAPGHYTLRLSGGPGRFNSAFLTTSKEITYPFGGDVDIIPASYIRFRIDKLPKKGLAISGSMRIHYEPWSTGTGYFTPEGMLDKPGKSFTKPGYSPWYCLQDLEHAPGFGGSTAHLSLTMSDGAEGATQFATFPHQDQVLREFDWNEPEGRNISLLTDFKTYLANLGTFRDHARQHYEYALAGSDNKLFPLTRGPLYFQPNGGAAGYPGDYEEKALRLMGMNLAVGPHANDVRRRYGFKSAGGHYWPPVFMPYEDNALKQYADYYKDYNKSLDEETMRFQEADEPGEVNTREYSAPMWRYFDKAHGGPKWVDYVGSSELVTTRLDYFNCVLEGKIQKNGPGVNFKMVTQGPDGKPQDVAFWWVGPIKHTPFNMSFGRQPYNMTGITKPGIDINGGAPTPFKMVLDGNSIGLFVNGKVLHYFTDVPSTGGFCIYGPPKTITDLTLRLPNKGEAGFAVPKAADPDINGKDVIEIDKDEEHPAWAEPKTLEERVKTDFKIVGGIPAAQVGFRKWLQEEGVKPELLGKKSYSEISMLTVPELLETANDRRLYYWSRRYSGYLTPKMFAMAAAAIRNAAPNKDIKAFVALSGHSLNFPSALPLDMFQLAQYGNGLMPGISDAMSYGSWRWDSHQSVAFSVAPYNGGARQYGANFGKEPLSLPMMHCMWPNHIRAFTQVANNCKHVSYWAYGPEYSMTEWYWSEGSGGYAAAASIGNHSAMVDDVLSTGIMRGSRVAMLFSMSNEYWGGQTQFTDKRPAFLGLSHEYYQPYLVTEDQLMQEALDQYDALYVMDPVVTEKAQAKIEAFVRRGGLLWVSADALTKNEYNEPSDLLEKLGLKRTYTKDKRDWTMIPEAGQTGITKQWVPASGVDQATWEGAKVRARFGDDRAAWLENNVGKGHVVYMAFRGGHSYSWKAIRPGGVPDIWSDIGRQPLVLPLLEAKIDRELIVSQPSIMASPLTNENGTVIVLYNMQGALAKNLTFGLKEEHAPVSVQVFDKEMKLVPLPFEYRDGRAWFTLAELPQENMILVRSKPAPPDERINNMRTNSIDMMGRKNWEDISAGAWFAGFYPEWNLADRLVPLLQHEHCMVRRQAAESLGRLGYKAGADAIATQVVKETDSHARGDMLFALAKLGDNRFPILAEHDLSTSMQARVRIEAMRGAVAFLRARRAAGTLDEPLKAFGRTMFSLAADDSDNRVSSEAISVLATVDPQRCLTMWLDGYNGGETRYRDALCGVVANNDDLLNAALKQLPAGGEALLALCRQRGDKRLSTLMTARMDELAKLDPSGFIWDVAIQADPELSAQVFTHRKEMPDGVKGYLSMAMERTFNARIGNLDENWEEYLKNRK